LLDICTDYGIENNIQYNPNKTYLIILFKFLLNSSLEYNLSLSNVKINRVNSIIYLGYKLNFNVNCNQDALDKFKIVKNNLFSLYTSGLRPNGLSPLVQSFLYKTLCLSKYLYGLEALKRLTLNKIHIFVIR
jgi:hypothetical protein